MKRRRFHYAGEPCDDCLARRVFPMLISKCPVCLLELGEGDPDFCPGCKQPLHGVHDWCD